MPGPELGGGHEATRVFRFCRWCGGRLAAFGGCPTESGSPVGFVYPGSKEVAASRIDAIMSGLRVSGYAAPAQVELVARTADGDPARIAPLVEELIGKNVKSSRMVLRSYTQRARRREPFRLLHSIWKRTRWPVVWQLVWGRKQSQAFSNGSAVGPGYRTCASRVSQEGAWVVEYPISDVGGAATLRFRRSFLGRHPTQSRRDVDVVVSADLSKCADVGRTFCSSSPSGNHAFPGLRAERRVYGLRTKFARIVSARRRPCRQRVERSKSGRFANRATDQIRAGSQPKNRGRSRPIHSCVAFVTRRRGDRIKGAMFAFGPKQTSVVAPHMSAFGGKADLTVCGNPLSRSLLGAKRTCPFAPHMSANDPKRT
jgi:hypothetical protein